MKSHLKVHYFQHIAGEGFGSCYEFLKQHQAHITATEFFALPVDRPLEIEALPTVEEVDLLITLVASLSFPWQTGNWYMSRWAVDCKCFGCRC